MEIEQCMSIQVAEEVRYNMGLSIQDMWVGQTLGSQLAAGVVEVDMDELEKVRDREVLTVVAAAASCKGTERENMLAAEGAGRSVVGDENLKRSQTLSVVKNWVFDLDEAAYTYQQTSHPEN